MTKTTPMHHFISATFLALFLFEVHQYDEHQFAEAMRAAQSEYYRRLREREKEDA